MLEDLEAEAKEVGLEIHMGRTKVLSNRICKKTKIKSIKMQGRAVEVFRNKESTMYLRKNWSFWKKNPEKDHGCWITEQRLKGLH